MICSGGGAVVFPVTFLTTKNELLLFKINLHLYTTPSSPVTQLTDFEILDIDSILTVYLSVYTHAIPTLGHILPLYSANNW